MQEKYPPGTRVEVVSLCNEEEHLKPGMKGTVVGVDDQPALLVDWDKAAACPCSLGKTTSGWCPSRKKPRAWPCSKKT